MSRPLRCMFVITSMPVGGAETLLVNLVRTFDRNRIAPSICCLKHPDELGETLRDEIPMFCNLIGHRYDIGVIQRLRRLFVEHKIDCVITVGAGDKMFWGRLAARYAKVPVVLAALHSTGWPDGVGRLNRMLTRITDGFIAVADDHREYLIEGERFPSDKVFMIPNGIDTNCFQFRQRARTAWRKKLRIGDQDPVVGIVAALRPEKNHKLFIKLAEQTTARIPQAQYVIVGDGPLRQQLEDDARNSRISQQIHFLGTCSDVPGILSAIDLFALTSLNEASPVSILEALACSRAVVAPNVGSIHQTVIEGDTGFLFESGDERQALENWCKCLNDRDLSTRLGTAGRRHVEQFGSLNSMTEGYMALIEQMYGKKRFDEERPLNGGQFAEAVKHPVT